LRLWPVQQLLKPRSVLETQFQRLKALVDIVQDPLALHPIALLLEIKESAQTGGAWAASRAHVTYHESNPASEWLLGRQTSASIKYPKAHVKLYRTERAEKPF